MPPKQIAWVQSTSDAPPSRRRYTTEKDWGNIKHRILELWKQNVTVADIRAAIMRETGFEASISQYKDRLKQWGAKRHLNKKQRRYIIQQIQKRGANIPVFRNFGEVIDKRKVEGIWNRRDMDGVIPLDIVLSPNNIGVTTPRSPSTQAITPPGVPTTLHEDSTFMIDRSLPPRAMTPPQAQTPLLMDSTLMMDWGPEITFGPFDDTAILDTPMQDINNLEVVVRPRSPSLGRVASPCSEPLDWTTLMLDELASRVLNESGITLDFQYPAHDEGPASPIVSSWELEISLAAQATARSETQPDVNTRLLEIFVEVETEVRDRFAGNTRVGADLLQASDGNMYHGDLSHSASESEQNLSDGLANHRGAVEVMENVSSSHTIEAVPRGPEDGMGWSLNSDSDSDVDVNSRCLVTFCNPLEEARFEQDYLADPELHSAITNYKAAESKYVDDDTAEAVRILQESGCLNTLDKKFRQGDKYLLATVYNAAVILYFARCYKASSKFFEQFLTAYHISFTAYRHSNWAFRLRVASLRLAECYRYLFQYEKVWKPLGVAVGCHDNSHDLLECLVSGCCKRRDSVAYKAFQWAIDVWHNQRDARGSKFAAALFNRRKQFFRRSLLTFETYLNFIIILIGCNLHDEAAIAVQEFKGLAESSRLPLTHEYIIWIDHLIHITRFCKGNKSAELESLLLQDLTNYITYFPPQYVGVSYILNYLGGFYLRRKNLVKAITYLEGTLILAKNLYGENSIFYFQKLQVLADIFSMRGLVFYAKPLSHYIVKISERIYGPEDTKTIQAKLRAAEVEKMLRESGGNMVIQQIS